MNEANEEAVNENRNIGFLDMPMDIMRLILDNVDERTARNVFQLSRNTLSSIHSYNRVSTSITKLVCHARATDVLLRNCKLTVNDRSSLNRNTWTEKKIHIPKQDVISFLHRCAPQQLILNGSDEYLELDANWLAKISEITLHLSHNMLNRYLPILRHCCHLDIWYSGPCNATDIINSMASVEHFKFVGSRIKVNEGTLLALGPAIRRGRGLIHLEIYNFKKRYWFNLGAYVDFIQGLKVHTPAHTVNVGFLCVNALEGEILGLMKLSGLNVELNGDEFYVHRPDDEHKRVKLIVITKSPFVPDAFWSFASLVTLSRFISFWYFLY